MLQDNVLLFSKTKTCYPCRMLQELLDNENLNWKKCLTYINLNNPSDKDIDFVLKYNVRSVPCLIVDNEIKKGSIKEIATYIKELCTSE